ncbi:MAG: hypothetical protein HZA63_14830 [Rhodocyclales bacterium]|nr:hypothetical protein [Rhodocyclales bacterium]
MSLRNFCMVLVTVACTQAWAAEVALVMSVQGTVLRQEGATPVPLEAYAKLNAGDRLILERNAQLRLAYFENGRHETWSGPGGLETTARGGEASGLAAPALKSLPLAVARQLARTPADGAGHKAATRTRSVAAPDALARLEATYQELRGRAGADDLEPEAYLLSALFELRELDRVEKLLADLKQERPGNPEAALLASLYRKALKNVREARK